MSANLDLLCTEGPLAGERIRLSPTEPLRIGRTRRGLHLPDPLVSIEHAEISWTTDRYYVTDLGSLSGTFLDDRRLGHDPVPVQAGQTLQIGESTFQIVVRRERAAWFWPIVGVLTAVAGILLALVAVSARPVVYEPRLYWGAAVRQATVTSELIEIPLLFVREHGLDHRHLQIKRVTDFDQDGIDELWLSVPGRDLVITFDAGGWRLLGELPKDCFDRIAATFPDQRCGGDLYFFEDGRYRIAAQEGVTVWIDSTPILADPKAPVPPRPAAPPPYRFTLVEREQLAGFLAARGVNERVHYLICEEALPGVRAQVLTASGRLVPLNYGCVREMQVLGVSETEIFEPQPVAVAFTAAGRKALANDIVTTLGGSPEGLFLDARGAAVRDVMTAAPQPRVMMRLSFLGYDLPIDPIADEGPLTGARELLGSAEGEGPSVATTMFLHGPGRAEIDPPGCVKLEVESAGWACALTRLCRSGDPFMAVREVGCGERRDLVVTPYVGGLYGGSDGNVEVRVHLDTAVSGSAQVEVLRTRVSYRLLRSP